MSAPSTYITYTESGEITSVLSCHPSMAEAIIRANTELPYVQIVAPVSPEAYYAPDGVLTARPASTAHLVGNVLKGAPAGATVAIEGQEYTADGTDIVLEFEHPGTYLIKVDAFPQKTWEGEFIEDQA
ncbi:hypothetical protein G7007_21630 [Pseudomonas entomophila]|uniref:hypothetical protein n=1 Tax=Pseudomonas entomophila TaxID=312306 RepID=UPI0015E39A58|nr:hypothetical protein [Pseudomonas entomophila]MBA1195425.1 hypothetical protein [Pseudomonas entomophila]